MSIVAKPSPISATAELLSRYLTLFFHKSNGKNYFHFRFDGHNYSGFLPKTIGDRIRWDTAMTASLVKIGGRLRPVERSTRFV